MPSGSYPISGYVNNTNGSTKVAAAFVTAYNGTTGEWINQPCVTNSLGEYSLDAANFPSGYSDADIVYIVGYKRNTVSGETRLYAEYRVTLSTTTMFTEQDIRLKEGDFFSGTCKLQSYSIANSSAGGLYVDLYERNGDQKRMRIEIGAGSTITCKISEQDKGIEFIGGIAVIPESDSSTDLFVTLKINSSK